MLLLHKASRDWNSKVVWWKNTTACKYLYIGWNQNSYLKAEKPEKIVSVGSDKLGVIQRREGQENSSNNVKPADFVHIFNWQIVLNEPQFSVRSAVDIK